jgi:predicted nucleic acid-binding protein
MPEAPQLWLDTMVASNFALAGRLDVLATRYGSRLRITALVIDELMAGRDAGHPHLEAAMRFVCSPPVRQVSLTRAELTVCQRLRRTLGAGEASIIALANRRGGVVATDDQAARQACRNLKVAVTGTIGIILAAMRDRQIDLAAADLMHTRMVAGGFYSPVRKISDLLK